MPFAEWGVSMKNENLSHKNLAIYTGITFFLIGAFAQLFVLWIMSRSIQKEIWFTWTHPKEVEFARHRFELIQEASRRLYFEDYKMEGMTIIKPIKSK